MLCGGITTMLEAMLQAQGIEVREAQSRPSRTQSRASTRP
jgi:predicted transcriptional regulator of viral defense system